MAKEITVYGGIILKHKEPACNATAPHTAVEIHTEYDDNEIKTLVGKKVGAFGRRWIFAGDQGFKESNILVTVKWDDGEDQQSFVGRSALKDALAYIGKHSS